MTSERNVATSETINRFRIRWVVLSINVQAFTYEVFVVRLAVGTGVVTVVVGATLVLFAGTVVETVDSFVVCVPATAGVAVCAFTVVFEFPNEGPKKKIAPARAATDTDKETTFTIL